MAGIGFRLRKIMKAGTFSAVTRAYLYAALISSGPLVMAIICLSALAAILSLLGGLEKFKVIYATTTYIYAFSLIITSPFQLILSRFFADCDFEKNRRKSLRFFTTSLACVGCAALFLASWFFFSLPEGISLIYRMSAIFFFVTLCWVWLMTALVTALKHYNQVLFAFASGYLTTLLLSFLFVTLYGKDWSLAGFAIGHAVLFLLLLRIFFCEVDSRGDSSSQGEKYSYRKIFWKYIDLGLSGLFYSIGIWSDKIVFWFLSPDRELVGQTFWVMPLYDQAVFYGFLSIIPGMAIFLLRTETEFAQHYEEYFRSLIGRKTLTEIIKIKSRLIDSMNREIFVLVKIQGVFSLILCLLAPSLTTVLGLGALQTGIFQVVILGSLLLMLLLVFLTVLFYLDKRRDAMVCCLILFLVNSSVSWGTLYMGEAWYGLGFVLATFSAATYAAIKVNVHLQNMEYDTFVKQPLV